MILTALSKYILKRVTLFLHHLFQLKSFCLQLNYKTLALQLNSFKLLFTIDLQIQILHPPHPTVKIRLIKQTPTKVDKATR